MIGEGNQQREWAELNAAIVRTLEPHGRRGDESGGDYWLIDCNQGIYEQFIDLRDLELLRPDILISLQAILAEFKDWSIEIQVAAPDGERTWDWRDMIIEISYDRIIDRMRHELLPAHLRDVRFGTPISEYYEEMAAKVRRLMHKPD